MTKERFIANPFIEGELMYDTGDVVRYRVDGNIEYISRRDNQVKIRGFRIELGEIEALVNQNAAVKQGVVVVREDTPGDKRLVCYVVLNSGMNLTKNSLNEELSESLPDYMLPNHLVTLDSVPLTGSGKVDRKALPAPEAEVEVHDAEDPPTTPEEIAVAAIWMELLGTNQLSIHDNFFDVGGHSLLAIKVVTGIKKISKSKVGMRDLLTNTLGQLAAMVELKEGA